MKANSHLYIACQIHYKSIDWLPHVIMRKKYPYPDIFWLVFSRICTEYRDFQS